MKNLAILCGICLLLGSCLGEVESSDSFHEQIVVEGRIEAGNVAEVLLTKNLAYGEEFSEEDIREALIRWAKVTLRCSDGSEEILTGYYSDKYPTGFVYRSHRIIGEVGKEYSLLVEYSGISLDANTSIPEPVDLLSLEVLPVSGDDYSILARFNDRPGKDAYLFECKCGKDKYFRPAFMGIVNDEHFSAGEARITINRSFNALEIPDWRQYFSKGDTVEIRFSAIPAFAFSYWSLYENETINAINPIFPADNNLPTNIVGDGRGIWSGYGSKYYKLIIR